MKLPVKALLVIFSLSAAVACSKWTAPVESTTPAEEYNGPKISYQQDLVPLLERSCAPCHYPAKGGKKRVLDNYASVKKEINDILKFVQLDPSKRMFMPYKQKKQSFSAEEIEMFKNWARGGFIE